MRLSECPFCLICDLRWRKFSAFKGSCDYIGPTQIIHDHLPTVKSVTLITSAKSLLPQNLTSSQVPAIRARSSLDALCLPPTHVAQKSWAQKRQCPTAWSLGRKQCGSSDGNRVAALKERAFPRNGARGGRAAAGQQRSKSKAQARGWEHGIAGQHARFTAEEGGAGRRVGTRPPGAL